MSYATQQDLIDRYGQDELVQLTDRRTRRPAISTPIRFYARSPMPMRRSTAISPARVTTPVSPVPLDVVQNACVIARYLLWKDRASDRVLLDYLDTIKWLKDVAAGTASIGDNTAATKPSSAGKPQFNDSPRTFSATR